MKKTLMITLISLTASISIAAGGKDPVHKTSTPALSFTENKGQVCNQNYKPRPDVLFSGTDGQLVFHLKDDGVSYQMSRVDKWKELEGDRFDKEKKVPDKITTYRLDINWPNANKAHIVKGDEQDGFANYYLAQCPNGVLNVKNYGEVTYRNIYNGIDLKWYRKDGRLEYDYIVAPGGNYKQIQLEFKGAEGLRIDEKGRLIVKTPLANIIEEAPVVMQNGRVLTSKWHIDGSIVNFEIKGVNPLQTFVIDPAVRVWATYYTVFNDYANSVVVDGSGDVYMCGFSSDYVGLGGNGVFIATNGSHQSVNSGQFDAFLAKFNNAGTRLWATYYGGDRDEQGASSCSVDNSGNVFICGLTQSTVAISTGGSHQPVKGAGTTASYDAYLVKFNTSGVRQWGTYYGGTANEGGSSCAVDASGNVYMCGSSSTSSGTIIATALSHQPSYGGSTDAYLVKFNSGGVRQWATYYGGSGSDAANSCAVDASGNVFIAGTSASGGTVMASSGAHQISATSGAAFLVKFDATGIRQWATYYGDAPETGNSCATDLFGNVYLTGKAGSTTGIATSSSHQSTMVGGGTDAYLVKFSPVGVRQWATYYGANASSGDEGLCCKTDAAGNVYMCGRAGASTGTEIATPGSFQTVFGGGNYDAFLVKFTTMGVREWGTYYGGTLSTSLVDYATSCAPGANGEVYMCGQASNMSGTVIATDNSHQPIPPSFVTSGPFLAKFFDCQQPSAPSNITAAASQTICAGTSGVLAASATGTISWYATASSASVLGTGTVFSTPALGAPGTYTYYAEANVCIPSTTRTAITLTVMAAPFINVNSGVICPGQTFTLNPSGANTYNYSNGSNTVSPAFTSTYYVTGTSSVGCVSSNTAVSVISVAITPTISVSNGTVCQGQTFSLSPSGASTYTYSGGSNIVSPVSTATYIIGGISSSGCVSSNTVAAIVTVVSSPTISVNSGSICSGNPFVITATGASSYNYQGGSSTVSPVTSTNYTVTGVNSQACVSSPATVSVNVFPSPTVAVSSGSICSGNSFTLLAVGASSYNFPGGSNIVTPSVTTSYSISGTSTAGCVSSNIVIASVTVSPSPTLTVNSGSICSGKVFTIQATGASFYNYSGGASAVSPSVTTSYTVTGTSVSGCASTNTVVSTVTVSLTPTLSAVSGSVCSGSSFSIVANGVTSYSVSGGSSIVNPTATTSYSVTGESAAGCAASNTAVVTVTVYGQPSVNVVAINSVICSGETATLTASGADQYIWSNGGSANNIIVTPTISTTYTVVGTNAGGCSKSFIATLNVSPCLRIESPTVNGSRIAVYPNPNLGFVIIETNEPLEAMILDMLGKVVRKSILAKGRNPVDLSDLAKGVYFIKTVYGVTRVVRD